MWTECSKQDSYKLDRIQNSVMRLVLNESWDCPSEDMRSRLGWMTLDTRRRMLRVMCTRRYLRGYCPEYMFNLFSKVKDLGLRSARRGNDIHLLTPKTLWLANLYRASWDWNRFPMSIRNTSNCTFKSRIRQYFYNCNPA